MCTRALCGFPMVSLEGELIADCALTGATTLFTSEPDSRRRQGLQERTEKLNGKRVVFFRHVQAFELVHESKKFNIDHSGICDSNFL